MVWLAGKMSWLDRPALVGFACDCAERVLPVFEVRYPGDNRPRVAIETARRWLRGEAPAEECAAAADAAADAAYAAYAAADAAYAAAYAAYAAAAAYAAYAAADAYAAYAAADAAYAAADAERHWQADRMREMYTPEPLEGELCTQATS